MEIWVIIKNIVILLTASLLVGGLFARFKQSPIVGYLLAGMVLGGPGSIRLVGSEAEIETISELGVALLLFSLGLEFSVARLKKLGMKPLLGGLVQVILTLLLVFAVARLFGLSTMESLGFGAMLSLSSTAVVLRILIERNEIEMPHGRNSLGILLTQDIAVVPLALLMAILGGEGNTGDVILNIVKLIMMSIVLILGLMVIIRVAVLALGTLTLHRNRELTVIFAIVMGLGAAWVFHTVGISPALGAFVAGMLLGSSPFATQIRADISPLQVVLLTLFFASAGMVADPIWIIKNWYVVASLVIALTIGKLLVIWAIFVAFGQTHRVAVATGLCLAQVGEFAFVLGAVGRTSGVVSEAGYGLVVSTAIVSFFLSAFLVPLSPRLGNWVAQRLHSKRHPSEQSDEREAPPEVILIGYGPAGKIASQPLIDQDIRVTVIELNQDGLHAAREVGFRAELGDGTQSDVLEHARLHECKAVIITIPHYTSAMLILELILSKAPEVQVMVRSRYEKHTIDFGTAGAKVVAGDEEEVGQRLAKHINQWLSDRSNPITESSTDKSLYTSCGSF